MLLDCLELTLLWSLGQKRPGRATQSSVTWVSGVILNRLQPKFITKSVANEIRCCRDLMGGKNFDFLFKDFWAIYYSKSLSTLLLIKHPLLDLEDLSWISSYWFSPFWGWWGGWSPLISTEQELCEKKIFQIQWYILIKAVKNSDISQMALIFHLSDPKKKILHAKLGSTYASEPQRRVRDFCSSLSELSELWRALNFPSRASRL